MWDAVEHGSLDNGVVNHVFENNAFAHSEFMVETPATYKVTAEARVTTHAVGIRSFAGLFCSTYSGLVGHLETVGHVTGKRSIEDGCANAMIFDYIDNGSNQCTGAPSECATGLHDKMEMRMSSTEVLKDCNKVLCIILLSCHEMTTAHVEPLDLREPFAESLFDDGKGAFEVEGSRFAKGVEVKSLDTLREVVGEVVGNDTKSRSGSTRVV